MKTRITCFFISKTTIMLNTRETIYFIISISDKRLSSFFISLTLTLLFYLHLLFPYLFRFNFVVSERNVHILFADISGRNIISSFGLFWAELFFRVKGGGCSCTQCTPPPCVRAWIPSRLQVFIVEEIQIQQLITNTKKTITLFLRSTKENA